MLNYKWNHGKTVLDNLSYITQPGHSLYLPALGIEKVLTFSFSLVIQMMLNAIYRRL